MGHTPHHLSTQLDLMSHTEAISSTDLRRSSTGCILCLQGTLATALTTVQVRLPSLDLAALLSYFWHEGVDRARERSCCQNLTSCMLEGSADPFWCALLLGTGNTGFGNTGAGTGSGTTGNTGSGVGGKDAARELPFSPHNGCSMPQLLFLCYLVVFTLPLVLEELDGPALASSRG